MVVKEFDPSAPAWPRVCRGLALGGHCTNHDCEAGSLRVYIYKPGVKTTDHRRESTCDGDIAMGKPAMKQAHTIGQAVKTVFDIPMELICRL